MMAFCGAFCCEKNKKEKRKRKRKKRNALRGVKVVKQMNGWTRTNG